jgi:hypothetical protein
VVDLYQLSGLETVVAMNKRVGFSSQVQLPLHSRKPKPNDKNPSPKKVVKHRAWNINAHILSIECMASSYVDIPTHIKCYEQTIWYQPSYLISNYNNIFMCIKYHRMLGIIKPLILNVIFKMMRQIEIDTISKC